VNLIKKYLWKPQAKKQTPGTVQFQTDVCNSWPDEPKLVLYSTHETSFGHMRNIFAGSLGTPMLNVTAAKELRDILNEFIAKNA